MQECSYFVMQLLYNYTIMYMYIIIMTVYIVWRLSLSYVYFKYYFLII